MSNTKPVLLIILSGKEMQTLDSEMVRAYECWVAGVQWFSISCHS